MPSHFEIGVAYDVVVTGRLVEESEGALTFTYTDNVNNEIQIPEGDDALTAYQNVNIFVRSSETNGADLSDATVTMGGKECSTGG